MAYPNIRAQHAVQLVSLELVRFRLEFIKAKYLQSFGSMSGIKQNVNATGQNTLSRVALTLLRLQVLEH